jgi:hypothetical protein
MGARRDTKYKKDLDGDFICGGYGAAQPRFHAACASESIAGFEKSEH